jgi:hypothetical protein
MTSGSRRANHHNTAYYTTEKHVLIRSEVVLRQKGKRVLFDNRVWKQTLDTAWPTERSTSGDGHGVVTLFTGRVRVRRLQEVFGPLFPSSNLTQLPLSQST